MKTRGKRHFVVVEIECLDSQGMTEAVSRLHEWLEAFGHTACSHGFDFVSTSRLSPKLIQPKRQKQQSDGRVDASPVYYLRPTESTDAEP